MRIGNHRMTEEQVESILRLRKEGYSFSHIGRVFSKDHSTIMYHCQKVGVKKPKIIQISRESIDDATKIPEDLEEVNPGKNYADYLAKEKARDWKKRKDIAGKGF